MTKEDLITEVFGAINSFKRHRALVDVKPQDKMYHTIQMYKMFDKIELGLRAIKKENYRKDDEEDTESND